MGEIVCIKCRYVGKASRKKLGSTKTEAIGWSVFPFGIPYTLWRMLSKKPVCPSCGGEFIIKTNTIAGHRLVKIAAGEEPGETAFPDDKFQKATPQSQPHRDKPPQDPNLW